MRVQVEPAALREWSTDARRVAQRLSWSIAELEQPVGVLAAVWQGEAADRFAEYHASWQRAAAEQLTVLTELIGLVDTAHDNYTAAVTANARIWTGAPSTELVLRPVAAGRGGGGIDAEIDDIRATVIALVRAADGLATAWEQLAAAMAGTGAMAGDDPAGAAFGADHDNTAAAVWQGWRAAAILIDATAAGLAETGNNMLRAENGSTAGGGEPVDLITATAVAVPNPAPPPSAVGDNGNRSVVAPLAYYWPGADPGRLRAAAAGWRSAADEVRHAAGQARATVAALVGANPDPSLERMREFTDQALSDDPSTGLFGVLAVTAAYACDRFADATEETRGLMRDALVTALAGDEWYHPVATLLDAVLTRGAAGAIATAGDLALLDLNLRTIYEDHTRLVQGVRGEISPGHAELLTRLATALSPPQPVGASCETVSPAGAVGAGTPNGDRQALIAEVQAAGNKINPAEVLHIARAPDGRIIWIERGNGAAGLSHILRAERIRDFTNKGVAPTDIPGIAVRAVTEGTPLGRVRRGGVAYDVDVGNGRREKIVVVVGSNGYIVTARPMSRDEKLQPL